MSSLKIGVLAEPVLVGREEELEQLHRYLDRAVEGKGNTVLISGEAGGGKTRLTRDFLLSAMRAGVAVMAGWCLSDAQVPFFPFTEAFNNYFASSETEQNSSFSQPSEPLNLSFQTIAEERGITAWLTRTEQAPKHGKPEAISPNVWKDQVFAGVAKTLQAIAVNGPVILFIEDVHWADSASLALLHYIARAIHDSERVLVLATFRSEELTADAEGRPHPLAETLRMMRREELFTEIKLPSLTQACVIKIAENMIGASLQQELADKLAAESRGNPLFVVESMRMLQEHKSLMQENNEWRLAVAELEIPSKIKDIILRRLACLKYAQRRVLDAASVIGEEFDVELLSTVLQLNSLEVLETLNLISHSTSIVLDAGMGFRFDHARSREILYGELSPSLKRGYHARIAEKLESVGKLGKLPFSDLAYHCERAGNKEKAIKYALAAGQDELAKWSNTQAIKHFQFVLQNIPEGHVEEKRTALEGLGDAYASNCMYGEAIKTFDELAASEMGGLRLRAIRKASDAAYAKGDKPDLLLEYTKKAQDLAVSDRLEMARIIDNRGKAWGWAGRGDPKMDLADYDSALHVFEEENSLADVAEALWRSGVVTNAYFDLPEKGLGELLRSAAIFKELGDVRKEVETIRWLGQGLHQRGLYPEAIREFTEVLRIGEKLGIFTELTIPVCMLSRSHRREGRLEDALAIALKGLEYSKKTDANWTKGAIYSNLMHTYILLGDFKNADEYFDRICMLPPEVHSNAHNVVLIPWAKGEYFAAKACWEESNKSFEKLLEFMETVSIHGNEALIRRDYACALEKQGRVEEAKFQRDKAQKLLDQAEKRFARANVQLNLMVSRRVLLGDEFEMRFDLVNVSRAAATLTKIDRAITPEFKVSDLPAYCKLQNGSLEINEKSVGPFQVETLKLKIMVDKAGSYVLNPEVSYLDDEGKTKTFKTGPITVTLQPSKPAYEALPGRISTGTVELDRLLLGGIPEGYAVVLASSSSEERELLIKRFLEAGTSAGETVLVITCETDKTQNLATQFRTNFYLLDCNPQANLVVQDLPNIFILKGIDNLTDIDIALTKFYRTLDLAQTIPKRACITLLSDVLLWHHAVITRKWLGSFLANLKSKGFTTLAVIDPCMHAPEETQAILSLFEGEIRINEKETADGVFKSLRIRKLTNQKYSEKELVLTKEKLL
jgi:KaiC/GvpD/RAD55 family RecA-like ATPase/tetratricopeptide (TPR) repeat protein